MIVYSVESPPLLNESTLTFHLYLSHFTFSIYIIHNVGRGRVKRTSVGEVHEGTVHRSGHRSA